MTIKVILFIYFNVRLNPPRFITKYLETKRERRTTKFGYTPFPSLADQMAVRMPPWKGSRLGRRKMRKCEVRALEIVLG